MKISALVQNSEGQNTVTLRTNDHVHSLSIPPKQTGFGSSANGGELLFLALATCYCNDVYREAAKRGLKVERVEVEVEGDFGAEGEPAKNVVYRAKVTAQASEEAVRELMRQTDQVAEIQNTLRVETPVILSGIEYEASQR
jgi:organic hydroperoxide reductase OsmC/OhrA